MISVHVRLPDGSTGPQLEFTKLEAMLRFQDVSTWTVNVPTSSIGASDLSTPGSGIYIVRDEGTSEVTLLSGPMTTAERQKGYNTDGVLTDQIIFTGVGDEAKLWDRLVYPCAPETTTFTKFEDSPVVSLSGAGETVIKQIVRENAIDGTWARPIQDLSTAPDLGRGSSVTISSRLEILGDLIVSIARQAGDLGIRVIDGVLDVYEPQDLSDIAVFSFDLNNLYDMKYTLSAPTANAVVVGGKNDGIDRLFVLNNDGTSESLWKRRIERLVDQRHSEDLAELTDAATEALDNGQSKTSLEIMPLETDDFRFGIHYNLGDLVTVEVDGQDIVDVVRSVLLTFDETGLSVIPTVETAGKSQAASAFALFDSLRAITRRVVALERNM